MDGRTVGGRTESVKKTIGIVAEGPRDFELIAAVIDTITNEENDYRMIQPETNMIGQFGNGWKGVWKWCEDHQGKLDVYMHSSIPILDLLVIHMDGDVQRCEKEVHCSCQRALCNAPEGTHPLTCEKIIGDRNTCPVTLPCGCHGNSPDAGADFLRTFIRTLLLPEDGLAVSYVIPFDATDTWVVAAFEQCDNYEILTDPWGSIIAHAPQYHGVKIKNCPQKEQRTYEKLIATVCNNWSDVVVKYPQAKLFDEDVRRFLVRQENAGER